MTSPFVRVLVCGLGLSLLCAGSAQAAQHHKKRHHVAAPQETVGSAPPCRRPDVFMCGPLTFGNVYLGDDPDPFIRSMIQRDPGRVLGDPD